MFFHQRFIPGLAIASYMVGDEKAKEVAVIDPTRDVDEYIRLARAEGLRITHVLETHVHADYVSGAVELKARLGGSPIIVCSGMGGAAWTPAYADLVVRDGDEVKLGQIRLRAIHTPGHTPEHVAWALYDLSRSAETPWLVFTGDFLFVGDVGRPDLLGPAQRAELVGQLYRSVFERLPSLPDYAEIFPGHGAGSLCGKAIGSRRSSTVGFERRFNPALQPAEEPQWTSSLLSDMPPAPRYFRRMKEINARGPALLGEHLPGLKPLAAGEARDRLRDGDCIVLDVRPEAAFAAGHLAGAINIPLGPNLALWAGWVLPDDKRLVIVIDDESHVREVVTHLIRVGLDQVDGFLSGDIESWQNDGLPITKLRTIAPQELDARLKQGGHADRPLVLDVRTGSEWRAGHIDGAAHIHAGLLSDRLGELPKDRPIVVACGSGYRASIAASLLRRHGYRDVTHLVGGMTAWNAAGLPTVAAT